MRDVRLAGEKLLQERGTPVPPLRKMAPWSDLDEPTRIEMDWYRSAKPILIAAAVPTMEDLKKEWLEINPKRLVFVDHPVLGVPYPINTGYGPEVEEAARLFPAEGEDYWQWIEYIKEVGAEQLKIGGIKKPCPQTRHPLDHKCDSLWRTVTWYEDLYYMLTRQCAPRCLSARDREMDATVRQAEAEVAADKARACDTARACDKARAHAEDVETLLAIIKRKNKEIADLKGLLDKIKAICE